MSNTTENFSETLIGITLPSSPWILNANTASDIAIDLKSGNKRIREIFFETAPGYPNSATISAKKVVSHNNWNVYFFNAHATVPTAISKIEASYDPIY
ncbi:hypothetical protein D3C75_642020 [compost metagenome]